MTADSLRTSLFEPFTTLDLALPDRRDGKVRTSWAVGDTQRLIVTTDRLSAFDRVLAGVPYKGQVLNQLAAFWFERTADLIANHVVAVPDPNALLARAAHPLPVEVVTFGWTQQEAFLRELGGQPTLRRTASGEPFVTNQGNYILDCDFGRIPDPYALADTLKRRTGIVEHGLFLGTAGDVIVAGAGGIRHLTRD